MISTTSPTRLGKNGIAMLLALISLVFSTPAVALLEYATGPTISQNGVDWTFVPLARFTQSVGVLEYDPTPERVRQLRATIDNADEREEIPVYWRHLVTELNFAYVYIDMYARYDREKRQSSINSVQMAPKEADNCGYCQVLVDKNSGQYAVAQNLIFIGLHEPELAEEIARITGAQLIEVGEQVATLRAPQSRDLYQVYQRLSDLTHLRFVNVGILR